MGCKHSTSVRCSNDGNALDAVMKMRQEQHHSGKARRRQSKACGAGERSFTQRTAAHSSSSRPDPLIDLCMPRNRDSEMDALGDCPTTGLLSPETYKQAHIAALRRKPNVSVEWAIVGNMLLGPRPGQEGGETVEIAGRTFRRRDMFLEALRRCFGCPFAWLKLAEDLLDTLPPPPAHDTGVQVRVVDLPSGQERAVRLSRAQVLVHALDHNPTFARGWDALGRELEHGGGVSGGSITVLQKSFTVSELFREALRCDPLLPDAHARLAAARAPPAGTPVEKQKVGEEAPSPGYRQRQMLLAALNFDQDNMNAWRGLARVMRRDETVRVAGVVMSRPEVLQQVIRCHPLSESWHAHWDASVCAKPAAVSARKSSCSSFHLLRPSPLAAASSSCTLTDSGITQ